MAIATPTNLTSGFVATNQTGYVTASILPTIGTDGVVFVSAYSQKTAGSHPTVTSVAGCGLTWAAVGGANNPTLTTWRTDLWVGKGTPTSGAITITFSAAPTGCYWIVDQFATGVDTTGSPIQQAATAVSNSATSLTVTLATFTAGANATYGSFVHRINEDIVPGSGFTQLTEFTHATPDMHGFTEYLLGNDTTVDATWATTQACAAVACEIKASVAGGPQALAGSVAAVSTVTGTLIVSHPIAGTVAAVSTVTGDLLVGKLMNGTVTAVSTVAGNLTVAHTLVGTAAATSTLTGALTLAYGLAGTVTATSTFTGDVTTGRLMDGLVVATSTVTGDLTVSHPIAGTVTATSTVTGSLSVTPTIPAPPSIGICVVSSEQPAVVQVSWDQPYDVAMSDERPYAVTILDEQG